MRYAEIFEAQQYLDPYSHGSWFNPFTKEYLPVEFEEHSDEMRRYIQQLEAKGQDLGDTFDPKKWAFEHGWIRIRFNRPTQVYLQAKYETLVKAWRMILPQLLTMELISLDLGDSHTVWYQLPRDKEKVRILDVSNLHKQGQPQGF